MTTATATITPDECFEKAFKALDASEPELGRAWRQLGEAISNVQIQHRINPPNA